MISTRNAFTALSDGRGAAVTIKNFRSLLLQRNNCVITIAWGLHCLHFAQQLSFHLSIPVSSTNSLNDCISVYRVSVFYIIITVKKRF